MKFQMRVVVPKGYRLLRKGEVVQIGDLYASESKWVRANITNHKVGTSWAPSFYIRRKPTKRRAGK